MERGFTNSKTTTHTVVLLYVTCDMIFKNKIPGLFLQGILFTKIRSQVTYSKKKLVGV